jgi:hypothetical protein
MIGENHHNAKLKNKDIPFIRDLYKSGISQITIGHLYGVSRKLISKITSGKRWRSV